MEPKAFEVYRHFKGNLYQVITLAEEEETGNKLVIYQGLYAPFKVYARPLSVFLERLDRIKYPNALQEYRFERVVQTESAQTESVQTESVQTESVQIESVLTDKLQSVKDSGKSAVADLPDEKLSEDRSNPKVEITEPTESSGGVNPDLLLFLDAREPEEKLDALFRIKNRLTPDMMTVLELSQGMEPQETWSLEERYKHIKNNIITKQKYEQKRM